MSISGRRCQIVERGGEVTDERDLRTVVALAREAGLIGLMYFQSDSLETRPKGESDVVTVADLASERLLRDGHHRAFPGDGVVGEEGSMIPSSGTRRWFIDPLDGTLNYSRGIPIWCVSLSLFDNGRPILGVIHDPIREETFCVDSGSSEAWTGDTKLAGSSIVDLERAVVHVTVDFHESPMRRGLDDLRLIAPCVLRTRNIGSAALALAYVAAGRFDAMLHRFAHTWDYGAGVAMIRAAGGTVTNMDGDPYGEDTESIVAAGNPILHEKLLAMIRNPPVSP